MQVYDAKQEKREQGTEKSKSQNVQSQEEGAEGPGVQGFEEMRISDCGIEEVVSGQFSVVSRVFSGDRNGSSGELRIGGESRITNHGSPTTSREKGVWPNEPIYGKGVVKPSVQGKFERSLRTSPSPSASVDLPHLSRSGGWTMMYLLPHIP